MHLNLYTECKFLLLTKIKLFDNMKIKLLLFISIFLITSKCYSQKVLLYEWKPKFEVVAQADTLYYYGLDLSKVRLTDISKIPESKSIKNVYAPAWISAILDEIKINDIKKYHQKKKVDYINGIVEKRYMLLPDDFVIAADYTFPIDTVVSIIKEYELKQKSGVGMVIIAENFNEPQKAIYTYHVFFDILTRELLWAIRVKGMPKGIALSAYWGEGIAHNILFETQVYKKNRKKL